MLTDQSVDIMAIGESKLDGSFLDAQFRISNYRLYHQDRDERGGDIMIYIKDSYPHWILQEHPCIVDGIEYMFIELSKESKKMEYGLYLPTPQSARENYLWLYA